MSIIEKAVSKLDQAKASGPVRAGVDAESVSTQAKAASAMETAASMVERTAVPAEIADNIAVSVSSTAAPKAPEIPRAASGVGSHTPPSNRVELDLGRLTANNIIGDDGGRNPVAEEFRAIKRPLISNAFAEDGRPVNRNNLIMVTSALPGEGKTFTAINLAISIAMELDHTVLLVDADVARPSVLRMLSLKSQAGLMDILLDAKLDVADVLLKTNIDTLSILPAGKGHRHATELLASQTMSSLLDEIASRYPDRIVIFDSPPLLLTSEARVLASQMGQIVVVVEAETTTMNAVKNALSQLEACTNVNLVYNKAKSFPGQENYGYYYN